MGVTHSVVVLVPAQMAPTPMLESKGLDPDLTCITRLELASTGILVVVVMVVIIMELLELILLVVVVEVLVVEHLQQKDLELTVVLE
jgi:hypothetical protein